MPSYYIAKDRSGNYELVHGRTWAHHKYIRKEGNRYIYPNGSGSSKKRQAQTVNDVNVDSKGNIPQGRKTTTSGEATGYKSREQMKRESIGNKSGKKDFTPKYKVVGYRTGENGEQIPASYMPDYGQPHSFKRNLESRATARANKREAAVNAVKLLDVPSIEARIFDTKSNEAIISKGKQLVNKVLNYIDNLFKKKKK